MPLPLPRASVLLLLAGLLLLVALVPAEDARTPGKHAFVFRDTGNEAGLFPAVGQIMGHGAGWGDVDGDGWIDLYVATFHTAESKANMLFRNNKGTFRKDDQPALNISSRGTGVLFADLDNDGDLDLYLGSMPMAKGKRAEHEMAGCSLLRNDGGGKFTNISAESGACPRDFGGRSVTVLDFDGDGLLDLLVGSDPFPGYNGSKNKNSRLFRNKGKLQFEDVSRDVGLPEGIPGLGVAAGDVNNDGWPDFFLASSNGGNALFLNDGKGKFRELPGSRKFFAWKGSGGDNMICGVCFADVNRDGLLDMVIGQHYSLPWLEPMPVRLYLNRGIEKGDPIFEDVTEKVGLKPLPMKAPHVEIQDFDNDGWPDIYVSMVKFKDDRPYPVIFRHLGSEGGLPRFQEDAMSVNDFPTEADRAIKRSGEFFTRMVKDKKIIYMAPGPSGDYDNDGRLDLFLPNWWVESRSLLLRNETPGGNWLQVQLRGPKGVNSMGIGARIKIFTAGKLGQPAALLGCRDMAAGYGYASGQPAIAHFGVGKEEKVDVEVILPHGRGKLEQKGVRVNERITVGP